MFSFKMWSLRKSKMFFSHSEIDLEFKRFFTALQLWPFVLCLYQTLTTILAKPDKCCILSSQTFVVSRLHYCYQSCCDILYLSSCFCQCRSVTAASGGRNR